jgi:hypothetical protein
MPTNKREIADYERFFRAECTQPCNNKIVGARFIFSALATTMCAFIIEFVFLVYKSENRAQS